MNEGLKLSMDLLYFKNESIVCLNSRFVHYKSMLFSLSCLAERLCKWLFLCLVCFLLYSSRAGMTMMISRGSLEGLGDSCDAER